MRRPVRVVNSDSGFEVRLTHVPSGEVGGDGVYRASWRDKEDYIYMKKYDSDVIHRHIEEGYLKVLEWEGEEEEMQLPSRFYFKAHGQNRILTATIANVSGTHTYYDVTWWDVAQRKFLSVSYSAEQATNFVKTGAWVIEPETFEEPKEEQPGIFNFVTAVTAEEQNVEDDVQSLLDREYDFPALLADDEDMELSEIRKFTQQTNMTVEVCQDFYTIRGSNGAEYVASSVKQLRKIMDALVLLEEASNGG